MNGVGLGSPSAAAASKGLALDDLGPEQTLSIVVLESDVFVVEAGQVPGHFFLLEFLLQYFQAGSEVLPINNLDK